MKMRGLVGMVATPNGGGIGKFLMVGAVGSSIGENFVFFTGVLVLFFI